MIGNDSQLQAARHFAGRFEREGQRVAAGRVRGLSRRINVQLGRPARQHEPDAGQSELVAHRGGGEQGLSLPVDRAAHADVGTVAAEREADRAGRGMQRAMGHDLDGRVPRAFAVKLTGEAGNPDAIGSRITVVFTDGSLQAAELAAGSGYLTQSEPMAFFSYAVGNVPTTVKVTWPDGTLATYPFKPGSPRLVLTKVK